MFMPSVSLGCVTRFATYTMGTGDSLRMSETSFSRRLGSTLVKRLPGPSTIRSAEFRAFLTPSSGGALQGSIQSFASLLPLSDTSSSPFTALPSFVSPFSTTFSVVTGSTCPLMASILFSSSTARWKSPIISVVARRMRLPRLCPLSSPLSNLKLRSLFRELSFSASATMQFLMSPGGSIPHSCLRRPELPPSSVTATTAVMFLVKPLRPASRVERPVPPPIVTILGPRESLYSTAFVIIPWRPEVVLF